MGNPSARRRNSPDAESSLNRCPLQHRYSLTLPHFCLVLSLYNTYDTVKAIEILSGMSQARRSTSRLAQLRTEDAGERLFGGNCRAAETFADGWSAGKRGERRPSLYLVKSKREKNAKLPNPIT